MYYYFYRTVVWILFSLMVSACATAPEINVPDKAHVSTAKRFLNNVGAGELAMKEFRQTFENMETEQPGMAELARRAFINFKEEDFEDIAAGVYSRHLSQKHLSELAQFTEKPAVKKVFRLIFSQVQTGKPLIMNDILNQFNADELTEILKFSQSDGFLMMAKSLPEINRDLSEAGHRMGEEVIREFINQQ